MIDDANPINNDPIDDETYDRPAEGEEAAYDPADPEAELLRAADAAIDAEDANPNDADPDLAGSLDEDVDEYANEFMAAMANQQKAAAAIADATAEAPRFYEATADLHALDDLNLHDRPSVLERLGPAHFRSKGFSFMGFLQTVYDHVATEVKANAEPVGEASLPVELQRDPNATT